MLQVDLVWYHILQVERCGITFGGPNPRLLQQLGIILGQGCKANGASRQMAVCRDYRVKAQNLDLTKRQGSLGQTEGQRSYRAAHDAHDEVHRLLPVGAEFLPGHDDGNRVVERRSRLRTQGMLLKPGSCDTSAVTRAGRFKQGEE